MLELFGPSGLTPRLVELFEQQGDLFLVQEAVPGVTLREWVPDSGEPDDGGTWGNSPVTIARMAGALIGLVALVHDKGLVLRDLDPNNVMVTPDGELRLIDLELLARPGELVAAAYTPGYVAPELAGQPPISPAPEPTADLFGLGATLFYLVTGTDPLLPPDEPDPRPHRERIAYWLQQVAVSNEAARRLAPFIVALLHEDPARRPRLEAIRAGLADQPAPAPTAAAREIVDVDPERLVGDALGHLLATMDPNSSTRLWPSAAFGATTDPLNVQHGAAGVLRVLTLAHEVSRDPGLREAVDVAARWIGRRVYREPRVLPGLYFGRSGTAWALLEAGRTLGDADLMSVAADLARRVPVRWPNPDVCHGVAGAGLTQLSFWGCTGDDEFLARACQAADSLVSAARRHGRRRPLRLRPWRRRCGDLPPRRRQGHGVGHVPRSGGHGRGDPRRRGDDGPWGRLLGRRPAGRPREDELVQRLIGRGHLPAARLAARRGHPVRRAERAGCPRRPAHAVARRHGPVPRVGRGRGVPPRSRRRPRGRAVPQLGEGAGRRVARASRRAGRTRGVSRRDGQRRGSRLRDGAQRRDRLPPAIAAPRPPAVAAGPRRGQALPQRRRFFDGGGRLRPMMSSPACATDCSRP
jgi:hypothetical protein